MNTAFFNVSELEEEVIKQSGIQSSFFKEPLTKESAGKAKDCEIISITSSSINKEMLNMLPKLKLVATRSTGFDHIDLDECKKRNITVCNVPHYGENLIAEHTFALILAISRKICKSSNQTKKGNFSTEGLRGIELQGKTIGIIGAGNIGKKVIKIANGFEMKILVYDIKKDKQLEKRHGCKYVELDYLLKNSDVITLHAPLNKETLHMINQEKINNLKKGAIIINTARGGLIETEALIKALREKQIKAGLDVLENEREIKKGKIPENMKSLLENENVIITPHNAFNSKEAITRKTETTINNIKSFIKGKPTNIAE